MALPSTSDQPAKTILARTNILEITPDGGSIHRVLCKRIGDTPTRSFRERMRSGTNFLRTTRMAPQEAGDEFRIVLDEFGAALIAFILGDNNGKCTARLIVRDPSTTSGDQAYITNTFNATASLDGDLSFDIEADSTVQFTIALNATERVTRNIDVTTAITVPDDVPDESLMVNKIIFAIQPAAADTRSLDLEARQVTFRQAKEFADRRVRDAGGWLRTSRRAPQSMSEEVMVTLDEFEPDAGTAPVLSGLHNWLTSTADGKCSFQVYIIDHGASANVASFAIESDVEGDTDNAYARLDGETAFEEEATDFSQYTVALKPSKPLSYSIDKSV